MNEYWVIYIAVSLVCLFVFGVLFAKDGFEFDDVWYSAFLSMFWPIFLCIAFLAIPLTGIYYLGRIIGQVLHKKIYK